MNSAKEVEAKYLTIIEFSGRFPDEKSCESHLFDLKYPNGFKCRHCGSEKFYRLHGKQSKRNRVVQCSCCKKQESITANTIFHGTRTNLLKWFYTFFYMAQNKKGVSAYALAKLIGVNKTTSWLMMSKIRKSMEERADIYQIGGVGSVVKADEIDIGGKGSDKQKVLMLLEKKDSFIVRVRFAPIPDKSGKSILEHLLPMVADGSEIHTDGSPSYLKISEEKQRELTLEQVSHQQENYSYTFLKSLDVIVGNLKKWYQGIHHHFDDKNTAYYLNEFAYRFNRRKSDENIFDRLLSRSVKRPQMLTYKQLTSPFEYLPLAI